MMHEDGQGPALISYVCIMIQHRRHDPRIHLQVDPETDARPGARQREVKTVRAYEPAQTVVTVMVKEARYAAAATLAAGGPPLLLKDST